MRQPAKPSTEADDVSINGHRRRPDRREIAHRAVEQEPDRVALPGPSPGRALERLAPAQRHAAVLGLQRTVGNAAVARMIASHGASIRREDGAAAMPKDAKLTIAADKEADWWTPAWYEEFNVGHSWIMIQRPSGDRDSFGFWPANLGRGGGFDPSKPWKDVDGEVRRPDEAHRPTASLTVAIDQKQLMAAEAYAAGKTSAKYNLLLYNCTTFAGEMFKTATGQTAPSGGLLIDDPNDLAASIAAKNKAKGIDPLERPLPPVPSKKT